MTNSTALNTPRRMLSLDALSPSFRILADLSGKAPSADTLHLYATHFADCGLMAEAVNQAVGRIAVEWDKPYWPSAEMIAQKARRLTRDVESEIHGVRPRSLELDERAFDARERAWQDRDQRAEAWFATHAEHGRRIIAEVDREVEVALHRPPAVQLDADREARRAAMRAAWARGWREGAVVGACLLELTRAEHPKAVGLHAEGRGESLDGFGAITAGARAA